MESPTPQGMYNRFVDIDRFPSIIYVPSFATVFLNSERNGSQILAHRKTSFCKPLWLPAQERSSLIRCHSDPRISYPIISPQRLRLRPGTEGKYPGNSPLPKLW